MLAHFHFLNKGVVPFSLPHNEIGRAELSKAADLDDEQVDLVWKTSDMIKDPWRCEQYENHIWNDGDVADEKIAEKMKEVRERDMVGNEYFWVSFLFDKDWKPRRQD